MTIMFLLLLVVGFVAAAILHGQHNARQPKAQWPKGLLAFAAMAVVLGLCAAWVFTLPWDQRAAVSWVAVMFGPFLALAVAFGIVSALTEIVIRLWARGDARQDDMAE